MCNQGFSYIINTIWPEKGEFPVEEERKQAPNPKKEIYNWAQALVMALVLFVLLFTVAFRVTGVDGDSMNPTLEDGERLLVSNFFYTPKPGDVVIFTIKGLRFEGYPDRDMALVKRVIATGGQTVTIDFERGEVSVDGVLLEEPYIAEPTTTQEDMDLQTTFTVPEGKLFVMGDNRNRSTDSRDGRIGMVDERYVLGRVLLRLLPTSKFGAVE